MKRSGCGLIGVRYDNLPDKKSPAGAGLNALLLIERDEEDSWLGGLSPASGTKIEIEETSPVTSRRCARRRKPPAPPVVCHHPAAVSVQALTDRGA